MDIKSVFLLSLIFLICTCTANENQQFEGYVEGENIYLASPFYGVLQKLLVRRGEHVTKGELLFRLDPKPQVMNISQIQGELKQAQNTLIDLKKSRRIPELTAIEAQIEQAKAQIILAKLRVTRYQKLHDKKFGDKDTLDEAIANLKLQENLKLQYESNLALAKLGNRDDQINAQKSQVDSLSAKLQEAKWELAQKTVRAPASGVIFDTYYREGEFIVAQKPVVSLLTPENIQIEFFVPLNHMHNVRVGQKVSFDCEGCEKNNTAEISYVSPDAEYLPPLVYSRDNYSKLVFRIKARITRATSFKPGQPVVVTL
ncbi:hemolysin secretion protein D [Legionella antarctica]|uniref:Hemolysin secretion protein D n=1 Tax=Legionella antarctica TaxID=2708020 RepID=A0A6F8T9P5_9GAMM|nr:HlyD family efflux transporter periplasmic adaptor subunit [Legionella antarctica]BCA96706.1 hemolysin secretion protein D [Legionella antarctica]